jgi:hypothetical protein
MTKKDIPATYWKADSMLNGGNRKQVCHNTELIRLQDGGIGLILHSTIVVKFYEDGRIVLNSGGWHTVATKDRINRCLAKTDYRIGQEKFTWYIYNWKTGDKQVFFDGYTVQAKYFEERLVEVGLGEQVL